jgi:hypothetical protein
MSRDHNDDRYGKSGGWTYRVLSQLWTCPDDREAGQRHLTICQVVWVRRPVMHPLPDDVDYIDVDHEDLSGPTIEALEVDLERRRKAFDEPALIRAEWEEKIAKWERVAPAGSE